MMSIHGITIFAVVLLIAGLRMKLNQFVCFEMINKDLIAHIINVANKCSS